MGDLAIAQSTPKLAAAPIDRPAAVPRETPFPTTPAAVGAAAIAAGIGALFVRGGVRTLLTTGAALGALGAGVGYLAHRGGDRTTEYLVRFDSAPSYEPTTPSKMQARLDAHMRVNGPPVEAELAYMLAEGVITKVSPTPIANGYVIDVKNRYADEFAQRMGDVENVGMVEEQDLGG